MAVPKEQVLLVDQHGKRLDVEKLIFDLKKDEERILADDDAGLVVYVGDLEVYKLNPTASGEFFAQKVTQISRPRFSSPIIRKQIGASVLSITEDAIFIVRDGDLLKKVRAKDLKAGMILSNGEKVFR